MGGNNENDRVASPECVPVHLSTILYFSVSEAPEALRQHTKEFSLYPELEFSNETGNAINGTLVLKKGDKLNVTCYSNLEVQWIVTQGIDSYVSLRSFIVKFA